MNCIVARQRQTLAARKKDEGVQRVCGGQGRDSRKSCWHSGTWRDKLYTWASIRAVESNIISPRA